MDKLLEVNDLTIVYPNNGGLIEAVSDFDMELFSGETLALVGESGSGKSTIATSLLGLISRRMGKVQKGRIKFFSGDSSYDLTSLAEPDFVKLRRHKISMIFQDPKNSFNPVLSIGHQIKEALRLQHLKRNLKTEAIGLLEKVHIPEAERVYRSYPHELSGGQIQRAMIAMAIAKETSLLIADEATSALDAHIQIEIVKLLKNLKKELGWGILFISHDLALVRSLADRVILIRQGVKIEKGKTESIFEQPKNPYTRLLINSIPNIKEKKHRLPASERNPNVNEKSVGGLNAQKNLLISNKEIEDKNKMLHAGEAILQIKGISKIYKKNSGVLGWRPIRVSAVKNITLDLYKGEILGLVGESGCGKSTLGRMIVRLTEPTNGKILFRSQNIWELDKTSLGEYRNKVQILFQNPYSAFNPRMRVGQAVEESLRLYTKGKKRPYYREESVRLLELVGLEADHYFRLPGKLSGGQLQRASLARILAVKPELIVCDEPVSSVDVIVQLQILNLLKDLREQFNLSYIFISHDLPVVHHMSDRIAVMKDGQIVEMGMFHSLLENSTHPYTRLLLNAIP